jgi:hypothetical protein
MTPYSKAPEFGRYRVAGCNKTNRAKKRVVGCGKSRDLKGGEKAVGEGEEGSAKLASTF